MSKMDEDENDVDVISAHLKLETDEDKEPRVYLLVMPMEEGGWGVKPTAIPKKLYVTLVGKMNEANKIMAELNKKRRDGEEITPGDMHRIYEALTSDPSGEEPDLSKLYVKNSKNMDRMFG